jgi:CheY-like chemotaxis protein
MKNSAEIPVNAKDASPLPRFLRGLFRGRETAPVVDVHPPAPLEGVGGDSAGGSLAAPFVQPVDGHRPKVLVVDDDAVVLKALELKLSKAGCEVVTGLDGAEAVTTARKERPDVIVLDVNFPPDVALAWDGIGVMQWLQRLENGETPPVIIITGITNDQVRERALAAGALAFFQKPIDNEGLVEAINKALNVRRKNV